MKLRRWIKKMTILDLAMLVLLLFLQFWQKEQEQKEQTQKEQIQKEQIQKEITEVMSAKNGEAFLLEQTEKQTEERKKIAITFDDGPHPTYTEKLLDGLSERGVKGTFFVTGEHAALHPEIIRRMAEEGHLIGNHTYSHIQLRSDNRETFKEELLKTNQILKEITGEETLYVRPPYGTWDKKLEQELSMLPVLWTIDPLDWCSDDAGCISRNIIAKAGENDIILLHDYSKSSVEAALFVVDELLRQGYLFVTVDELVMD